MKVEVRSDKYSDELSRALSRFITVLSAPVNMMGWDRSRVRFTALSSF